MRLSLFLMLCITPLLAFSQQRVAKEVMNLSASGADFQKTNLFEFQTNNLSTRSVDLEGLSSGTILKIDFQAIENLINEAPSRIQMPIPTDSRSNLVLDLVQHNIHTPDYEAYTSDQPNTPLKYERGKHYRGVISGDENSIVSISVFKNEVMGLISSNAGNLVLGKLQKSKEKEHVLYYDNLLTKTPDWECGTPDDGIGYTSEQLKTVTQSRDNGDCIRLKIEIDNDIVNQKGGAANATTYLEGLFAQSATLYANDSIEMALSEIFAWTSTSPYSSTSSSGMLSDFQANTGSFNGDLAHLVSYQASGGIAAGFAGICASNPDNSKCFSSIDATYANVPTYSWSVMVFTHEMGHLIGSRHTHACVWNGNNTAIDGCAGSTEGSCPLPGNPSGGGTIMSYCHLTSVGINLNNGFGTQPGNVVRNTVNATGNCLAPCAAPTCTDGFQNGDEEGVDCGGSCPNACPTCTDGIQNGDETGVDCGGSNCNPCPCLDNTVTLTINLDNYPEETRWEIRNNTNSIVASGGTYGSQPDGSQVVENACLIDGCYDFIIYDSYGDGICCSYGTGDYTLTDGNGNTLASGGAFGSSETTNFCVVTGSGPTCTDGIQNGNETGVDCGGPDCPACPTCSDGVQNGNETGVDCGGPDCPACPTCTDGIQNGDETGVDCGGPDCPACPTCTDGIQNGDETGVDCGGPDCPACPGGGDQVLFGHFFETGLQGWVDGGGDCARVSSTRSWEGNYSVRLRDNSGTSSSMTYNNQDVSGFSSLELEFYFYPNSMESGEDFWVRVNDGSGWTTVASYASGTSFTNGSFYVATVTIPASNFNFNNPMDFRFQCDASANQDQVYIDAVTLTGIGSSALVAQGSTIEQLGSGFSPELPEGLTASNDEQEVMLYPNPAEDVLNLDYSGDIQSIRVMSMAGKQMKDVRFFNNNRRIDIGHLPGGMYIVMIEKEGMMIPKKFMKL